jgi:hypothetical protein
MSTSIESISTQLQTNTANQRTPTALTSAQYLDMAIQGTKQLYIDIGDEDSWNSEFDNVSTITRTLNILEFKYCVLASEIIFYEWLICDWNDLVSYTTNALTVANANKPYENFEKIIEKKQNQLVNLFYKMTEYTSMDDIGSIDVEKIEYDYD